MKIFLDANILIAATASETGGSHYLFLVAEQDATWQLITSNYALAEAKINVVQKLPARYEKFIQLITSPNLIVVASPPTALIHIAQHMINPKDAPILAAALFAQADALCTLDKKDFFVSVVQQAVKHYDLNIVTPADLLKQWRSTHSRDHS